MSLRRRFLDRLRDRLGGAVPLRLVFWDGERFDLAPQPQVTLTLGSRRLMRFFLTGDMGRLARACVEGELAVEGRLQDILRVGMALAEALGRVPLVRRAAALAAFMPHRRSKAADAKNVRYHYDVSNDFYRLWLDRHMIYSCAYFARGNEDLDTAQEQKLGRICRKLRLAPGERLLDIGCDWGGLACWAARHYGVAAVGVTLSPAQAEEARERVAAQGLADRVEIRIADYRDLAGTAEFDKIVSVDMYEHVGIANLATYFVGIARLLRTGGLLLNHGIAATQRDGQAMGPPGGEFIDRFVFPGGELPHLSRVLYEVAGAGLEFLDLEDLRPHYPPTLLHWVRRLDAARDAAIAAAGIERWRIWRMYMAGMAVAFERGWLTVVQLLAQKPLAGGPAPRPPSRRYRYPPAADTPLSRPLDWGDL
jgi:cyclopropane-fatty-acyl-phospholipid synthase